jgi:hypothetical protein
MGIKFSEEYIATIFHVYPEDGKNVPPKRYGNTPDFTALIPEHRILKVTVI